MEVEAAARRMLLGEPDVADLAGTRIWKFRLQERVEGTGLLAVVLYRDGGWAEPDLTQSSEYPLLIVRVYADPTRDEGGNIADRDAHDRAFRCQRVIDKAMHAKRGQQWGAFGSDPGLLVISSQRWSEPYPVTASDTHTPGSTETEDLGESMFVTCSYALHVAH